MALIIFAQALQFALNPSGSQVGDSYAYGFGAERDWSKFSFSGDALRNWPIVLVNLILLDPKMQIFFQTIFSTLVWCFLINTISKIIQKHYLLPSFILISVFSLSPFILSWNSVILAESYSISLIVLVFTLTLRLIHKPSSANKISLVITSYLWLSVHNRNLLAGLVLIGLLISLTWKKIPSLVMNNKSLTFLVVIFIAHLVIVGSNQKDQNYGENVSYNQVLPFYVFSNHPSAPEIQSRLLRVPEMYCMSKGNFNDLNSLVQFASNNCSESLQWMDSNFRIWYLKFLVANPKILLTMVNGGIIASNSPSNLYAGSLSIMPRSATAFYFGDRNYFLGSQENITSAIPVDTIILNAPIYLWMLIFLILFFMSLPRLSARNELPRIFLFPLLLIGSWALLWIFIMPIVIPSEFFRLTIQFYTILILSCILIVFTEFGKIKVLGKE